MFEQAVPGVGGAKFVLALDLACLEFRLEIFSSLVFVSARILPCSFRMKNEGSGLDGQLVSQDLRAGILSLIRQCDWCLRLAAVHECQNGSRYLC